MSPRRHLLVAGIVWIVLSAIGMVIVSGTQIIPLIASKEAVIENDAFILLTVLSVPVLLFVVVGLVYSAIRFRATDETTDGPPVHGHVGFQAAWLGVSFILVIVLFVYGTFGLVAIRGSQNADFEVNVHGEQWHWTYTYANGAKSEELHLPVDRRSHLIINSIDVIHSFWVPAFGVKQDAVPGMQTQIYVTPTDVGTYPGMCAELCGLGHTGMTTTVVVSDQAAVDDWLSHAPQPKPEPSKPEPSK
ncbi:MAG: cytochrome c oxidase subunit II [Candidatus Limnocylindrales bacterium]